MSNGIPKRRTAVLYARVSSTQQERDKLSLDDQVQSMEAYAKDHDLVVIDRYSEGRSAGEDKNRPVFDEMIYRCETAGDVSVILVHSFSRFYRDQIAFCVIERRLNRREVQVISITQPIEDSLARRVVMISDELFRHELSKHSKRTLIRNAQNGNHNGRAPFGYMLVEADAPAGYQGRPRKKLAINPQEADVVTEIFELAGGERGLKPMGAHRLCNHLNGAGRLMRGRPWRKDYVVHVLHATTYKGLRYWGRTSKAKLKPVEEWIEVPCPAIVTPELFDKVQALMTAKAPKLERRVPRNVQGLLIGPMVCGACGERYWTVTSNSGAKRHYACSVRAKRKGNCTGPTLPMEEVDRLVLGSLVEDVITPARIILILERLRNTARSSGSNLSKKKARFNSLSERLDRLYEIAAVGTLDPALNNKIRRTQADRELAAHEVKQEEELIEGMFGQHTSIDALQEFCLKLRKQVMSLGTEEKRAFIHLYITSIIVETDEIILTGRGDALIGGALGQIRSASFSPNPWTEFISVASKVGLPAKGKSGPRQSAQPIYVGGFEREHSKLGLGVFPEAWVYRVKHGPVLSEAPRGTFLWTTEAHIRALAKIILPAHLADQEQAA